MKNIQKGTPTYIWVSLTFNRPNPYSYFKKCSHSNDFSCNQYSEINKKKKRWSSVFLLYWFVLNAYFTSVNTTCLRSFGEYFFNWRRSGVLRLFLEVRYKRSPDSLCSSVIFTRMVSPFYYSADAALAILRPL